MSPWPQTWDSFFRSPELAELLDDMGKNGVARAILLTGLGKSGDRAQRYASERPDRFSLGVGRSSHPASACFNAPTVKLRPASWITRP